MRRERALAYCKQRNLQGSGRSCMYRKSLFKNARAQVLLVPSLYRENSEAAAIAKLSCIGTNRECYHALACTPLCSPERETATVEIGFSDMMCDVGNAAIRDAIANIARNREVLHFLSCISRFLGHFSGLGTTRQRGLLSLVDEPIGDFAPITTVRFMFRMLYDNHELAQQNVSTMRPARRLTAERGHDHRPASPISAGLQRHRRW